jgi:MoxR-like ATPase
MALDIQGITEVVQEESAFADRIRSEVSQVVVGQNHMVERMLIGLLSGGHILLEGVPGLAKTLTIKTLAETFDVAFQRIQFTPDMLPADITGTMIYNQKTSKFDAKKGPVFTNLVLADEINRAPAKVQSALLEAMQEHQVTLGDSTHKLPEPFLVLATQNPIEQEGTYPLPEAQVDRFMLKVQVSYPSREEEKAIIDLMTSSKVPTVNKVADGAAVLRARQVVNQVYIDDKIKGYIIDIVFATREPESCGLKQMRDYIEYGASPRASIYLAQAARAHAFLKHRGFVAPEDIKAIAADVLRHRIIPTFEAEAEEVSSEDILHEILTEVEVP